MNFKKFICLFIGHQYRNSVPQPFECLVYCLRCNKIFGHFDAPQMRKEFKCDCDNCGLRVIPQLIETRPYPGEIIARCPYCKKRFSKLNLY
jgi:DNA-directed RNA polymerase subunit RPC12/RpoP